MILPLILMMARWPFTPSAPPCGSRVTCVIIPDKTPALRVHLPSPALKVYRVGKQLKNEVWRMETRDGQLSVVIDLLKIDTKPEEIRIVR